MVGQKELTKRKAALLLILSAAVGVVCALELHGWHIYVGLALAGIAILFGFLRWNRKS